MPHPSCLYRTSYINELTGYDSTRVRADRSAAPSDFSRRRRSELL